MPNPWVIRSFVWVMVKQGIWNLFEQITTPMQRQEILDWYHLKENLFKVGGSLKRLHQAEALLWHGDVEAVRALARWLSSLARRLTFAPISTIIAPALSTTPTAKPCSSNPFLLALVQLSLPLSQIDRRLKLSGAQWNPNNVNQILDLRCAYLNGTLNAAWCFCQTGMLPELLLT